jgi:ubiquitin-conjugating enzyme E2 J2
MPDDHVIPSGLVEPFVVVAVRAASLSFALGRCRQDSLFCSRSISSILNGFLSFMCDTSATHGSIETTTVQKRKFAFDSLSFNIQDAIFCQLFPELTEEIRRILAERATAAASSTGGSTDADEPTSSLPSRPSWLTSVCGNLMTLVVLAAFAVIVRFILNSTG